MRKLLIVVSMLLVVFGASASYETWTDPSTGIKWEYTEQSDGTVSLEECSTTSGHPTGNLIVPSIINGKSVTSIGTFAFDNCSGLTSVTIPSSVMNIEMGTFSGCSGLTSITLPFVGAQRGNSGTADALFGYIFGTSAYSGATAIKQYYSYLSCSTYYIPTSLRSVVITDETEIGHGAFYGCSGLTSLTIPSSVTSIGRRAFEGTKFLNDHPDGLVIIDNCLIEYKGTCPDEVVIPNGVRFIADSAFSDCSGLTSVTIPSSVMSIGSSAFFDCSGLTRVDIDDLAAWSGIEFANAPANPLYYAGHLYLNGEEIKDLTVPEDVTSIRSYAFYGCSGLTSVSIPSSVTSIESSAFDGCSGLTSVTIPACVTTLSDTFPSAYRTIQKVVICEGVTGIERYAFKGCSGLNSVTIPSSVTSIGSDAFYNCSGLTAVAMPEGVTSIGFDAFNGCVSLNRVDIFDLTKWCGIFFGGKTSNPLLYAKHLYLNDEEITALEIPAGVTEITGRMFPNCCGFTSVMIPSCVTNIERGAFSGCSGLTSITLPFVGAQRDNSGTADALFGYIFGTSAYSGATATKQYYSSSASSTYYIPDALKSVIITDETKIGYGAFYNCSGLTSVTIPESVTDVEEKAFYGCSGLGDGVVANDGWVLCVNGNVASAEIPDGVKQIVPGAFAGHTELTSVKLPPTLERISAKDFSGCTGLEGVYVTDLAAWCGMVFESAKANPLYYAEKLYLNGKEVIYLNIPNGVEAIERYAFYNCNRFMTATIPESVTSVGDYAFYYCRGLASVVIPPSVTSIGAYAFYDCDGLTSVMIPQSVTSIGEHAFCNCDGLTSVMIPSSVTNIGGNAFYGCSGLTSVTIPSSVTSIGRWAFCACSGLTSVTIPSSVTSIGDYAFKGCDNIKSVMMPEWFSASDVFPDSYANMSTVTIPADATFIADGAFSGCSKITSIVIPSTVTSIGANAFSGCSGLTTVTIPNSVTNISSTAFKDCENIVSVTMPGRFAMKDVFPSSYSKIQDVTILDGEEVLLKEVFAECSALTTVVISEGVTTLDEDLFYGKDNLKELTLPSTVTSIGGYALYGCTSLETIHVSNDGDIDALKQMLYESGFDIESVTFDHVEEPVYVYYKVAFDAQGGVAERTETEVREGKPIGELPTAERDRYEFLGWFTSAVGGTQVTAATVVTKDVTFYAHWKRIGSTADEEVIAGEKVTIETGLVGYKASGLPSGLKYDAKTGKIAGTTKNVTAGAVEVVFTKAGEEDVKMTFEVRAEDVSVGCAALATGSFQSGVMGAAGGIPIETFCETGVKSVSVTKLPSGMKYDSKNRLIMGAPNKAGNYEVVLTMTTTSGVKETVKIPVIVAAMPVMAVGKFDGFVSVGEDNFGTFTLTTTDAGKLTAKVITAAGTVSFSGTCWDSVEDGVYRAALTTKKGETLTLTLDSTAAWDANQLSGAFTTALIPAKGKSAEIPSRTYSVSAQRNAFGKTWYFAATGDETTGWEFAYTEDTKGAALTVTLKADGSTSIAGKLPNGTDAKGKQVTFSVSASGYANVGGLKDGAILADFAPVLTVNKVKTVLAITTNLWFDRKNEVGRSVGAARFVK